MPDFHPRAGRTRLGRLCCATAVVGYLLAAWVTMLVVASPGFAADFDGGSRTADLADDAALAAGLLAAGVTSALGAGIVGGGHYVRSTGVVLVGAGIALAYVVLPLWAYYCA